MKYSYLFLVFILFSCKSKKYCLEENSVLTLKDGFYSIVPPAISEGNSSVKATLILNNFDKNKISLKGFYFRNHFISYKEVKNPFGIEGSVILDGKEEKIPFNLEDFEVVLVYVVKDKDKYVKFSLKRKDNDFNNIPMENKN